MRCEGRIWREHHHVQCSCEAKVTRDGKDYCGTHDPVRRKEKEAARDAKWEAAWKAKQAQWAAQRVVNDRAELCVAACSTLTDSDVSKLGALLSKFPKTFKNILSEKL